MTFSQDSNSDDLGKQFANKDAVHVLTYSIMMLNTDLHSGQVKKKMTLEVHFTLNLHMTMTTFTEWCSFE